MPVEQKAREALELDELDIPASMHVNRLEVEDYVDSTGDPSLRVLVVLDDSTDIYQVSAEDVDAFKSLIYERLKEHGITEFPYIFLAKTSELAENDEED